jgi:hypothetical protein
VKYLAKYTDEKIGNIHIITCKIAAGYLGIPPMAGSENLSKSLPTGMVMRGSVFVSIIYL